MQATVLSDSIVYRREGKYAGWPANHGMWQQDGKVIAAFERGLMDYDGGFHAIDRTTKPQTMIASSTDGIEWDTREPTGNLDVRSDRQRLLPSEYGKSIRQMKICDKPIDFTATLVKFRMLSPNYGPSYVNYSDDCGLTWTGPYAINGEWIEATNGRTGIAARTSYIVNNSSQCIAFMSASKESDGKEGQPFCCKSIDGGVTWQFLSWIDMPPMNGFGIMPSAVVEPNGKMHCCVRWRETGSDRKYGHYYDPFRSGITHYTSDDNGETWSLVSIPIRNLLRVGNPPDLVWHPNHGLILIYGWRNPPCGIVFQTWDGSSWTKPSFIREGAGCHDIGYTRSAVIGGDRIVSVYYWNDDVMSERYIASTLWELN